MNLGETSVKLLGTSKYIEGTVIQNYNKKRPLFHTSLNSLPLTGFDGELL